MDSKILKVLLLLGCAGCFIFIAACCGGDSWISGSVTVGWKTVSSHSGLWKACATQSGVTRCFTFGMDVDDSLKAIRAFSIGAVLAMGAAGLLALVTLLSSNMKGVIVSIFCFGSAGCMVIALSIYTNKTDNFGNPYASPGWSFILGALGAVGAVVSGIIGILAK